MTTTSTECIICTEKYNKTTRLDIKCLYCDFHSCRECCEKYILDQPIPKCMNPECGREWTRTFLRKVFTAKFVNKTYKTAREQILYEHELSLLPATQYLVEREIEKENILKEIKKLSDEQDEIRKKINSLYIKHSRVDTENNEETHNSHTLYVRKCSDPECRGFLTTQWKCGVCSKWTCKTCHDNIGLDRNVEHTCDPNNVATAELIAKDTKPCPKCKINIFKIEGCDQMWCTQCNTAFSWRTGEISFDEIHNPHYFEWLYSRGGRDQHNNMVQHHRCDEMRVDNVFISNLFYKSNNRHIDSVGYASLFRTITEICRNIIHLRRVEIGRYRFDKTIVNRDLRVLYMRNHIDKEYFKTVIQQHDKKHQKCRDMTNIFVMVVDTISDILFRLYRTDMSLEDMQNHIDEMNEMIKYTNECLDEVSRTYNSVKYYMTQTLAISKYT